MNWADVRGFTIIIIAVILFSGEPDLSDGLMNLVYGECVFKLEDKQ